METIHVKTVDPVSQDLLREASRRGVDLAWERFEALQPQDGFLRVGLSCPYGCLEGPCRIDPFERGAAYGICGLDRDSMAAALLLRLAVNGALEAIARAGGKAEPSWVDSLASAAAFVEKQTGGAISTSEAILAAASLSRPAAEPQDMVRQAVRLGVLALGLSGTFPVSGSVGCRAGYGTVTGAKAVIALFGRTPAPFVEAALAQEGVRVVSLGDWIPVTGGILPIACSSGEGEIMLASGLVDAVVQGGGTTPAISALCRRLEIPVFDPSSEPREVVKAAVHSRVRRPTVDFGINSDLAGEGSVTTSPDDLAKEAAGRPLAVFGGTDVVHLPLGWIASELAPALAGDGCCVAAWGDAATWMLKAGFCGGDVPIAHLLDPVCGAQTSMAAAMTVGRAPAFCFPGLRECREFAVALGLAALGARVCIGVPLPLWGSVVVRECLVDSVAIAGGEITHFDHPVSADEVLKWFRAK